MEILNFRVSQLKSLIQLAEDRGITTPISFSDVDDLVQEDASLETKLRNLERYHRAIKELLYTPPTR